MLRRLRANPSKLGLRQPLEGLKHALLLSSQPSLIQAINLESVPRDDVLRVYKWLEESGDRISQLGGIERGLAYLDLIPELESSLINIIQYFLDDDPNNVASRPTLLSSLIVMVEGEVARTGIAKGRPPFWRRLATIAHASALEREFIAIGMPSSEFNEWVMQSRGQLFYLQTYIDLRSEPRWLPDFVLPGQLKAECIGRIAFAAHQNAEKIQTPELKALLFAKEPRSVQGQLSVPFSAMPGPLEGGLEASVVMPSDFELELGAELDTVELTPKTFAKLVNSALFFQISPQLAELAAKALRSARYQIRQIGPQDQAFSLLGGLATVAAVTGSSELADDVRNLARVIRGRPSIDIAPEDLMRIAMVAAAGYREIDKWCNYVGDCLTELAFQDMTL